MSDLANWVRKSIDEHGRAIMGVFPTGDSTDPLNDSFIYSIGNANKDLPELLVVGTHKEQWLINKLSEIMISEGRKFDDGEMVDLGGKHPVCLIDADEHVKDIYTIQATNWHGGRWRYDVMQVVMPDKDGRFPWQHDCAAPYSRVVVHRKTKLQ